MSLFKLVGEIFVDTQSADKALRGVGKEAFNAAKKFQKAGTNIQKVGGVISKAGSKLTKTVTLPLVAIGAASVKTAAEFDSSMSQVQATMGITKDNMSELNGESVNTMAALSNLATQMGSTTAWSAKECADAINYLALAGYDTQEIYDTLPSVLSLASAGNMELAEASDMVTDAMSALGMNTSEAQTMVDRMAKTSSQSNTSVGQLGEAILKIGGTAKVMAGGTTELNTALGILADNGIKGSEGGTALRNILLSLSAPTNKAAKALKAMGVEVLDADGNMRPLNKIMKDLSGSLDGMGKGEKSNALKKIFNKNDLAGVDALLSNCTERWDELSGSIKDSGGAAAQMAETQLDNLNGQLTLLKSAMEGAAISIGQSLMPMIKGATSVIQGAVDKFNSLSDSQREMIVKIGLIVAAVGPVLIILGNVISFIGTIVSVVGTLWSVLSAGGGVIAALTAAFGAANVIAFAIVAGIAAVIAIGVLLWKNWDTISAKAKALWSGLKESFTKMGEGIGNRMKSIKDNSAKAWKGITDKAKSQMNVMKNAMKNAFNGMKETAKTVMSAMSDTVKEKLNNMRTAYNEHGGGMKGIFYAAIEGIKGCYTAGFTFLDKLTGGKLSEIAGKVKEKMASVKDAFTSKLDDIKKAFADKLQGLISKAAEIVNGIKAKFNITLPHPTLKLPHLVVTGKWSFNPPSVPKFGVEWYKKAMNNAMLLDAPTIFGMGGDGSLLGAGEAGTEVVSGASTLMSMIKNAVDGENVELLRAILAEIKKIRSELYADIMAALESTEWKINDRELARLVRKYAGAN